MSPTQVCIHDQDVESSTFPRWQLLLLDHHHPYYSSRSILQLEWSTRDDGKWGRRNYHRAVDLDFSDVEVDDLITGSTRLHEFHPDECLDDEQVHTHGGYSPTRANGSSVICRSITFFSGSRYESRFYLRKDSLVWSEFTWGRKIMNRVNPYLIEAPWRHQNRQPKLP